MIFITDETVTDCEGMHGPTAELFIYSVICRDTFIGGAEFPSLRRVYIEKKQKQKNIIYSNPYYIPIKQGGVQQLHIYIKDGKGEALHFKRFPFVL